MARSPAEIVPLFATPLLLFDVPDAATLNAELRDIIIRREASQLSTRRSNQGGWQSTTDMDRWGGAAAIKLLAFGRNVANQVTTERSAQPGLGPDAGNAGITWRGSMWANVNRSGDANELHWHRAAFWAAVYYVDDGGINADETLGGELEFVDPRGSAPTMFAPHLAVAIPGGLSPKHRIRPKAGRLVMFPAWLMHQVRPYRGTAERISIAFNLTM